MRGLPQEEAEAALSLVCFFVVVFFILESHEFLDRADASSYFLLSLTTAVLFGLIRVQCSR